MIFLKQGPLICSAIKKARQLPQLSLGKIGTVGASSQFILNPSLQKS
jgi:hypothetical protein